MKDIINGPYCAGLQQWLKKPKTIIVFGILYTLSPIDIIPDPIFLGGWIDDIMVIIYVVRTLIAKRKEADVIDT